MSASVYCARAIGLALAALLSIGLAELAVLSTRLFELPAADAFQIVGSNLSMLAIYGLILGLFQGVAAYVAESRAARASSRSRRRVRVVHYGLAASLIVSSLWLLVVLERWPVLGAAGRILLVLLFVPLELVIFGVTGLVLFTIERYRRQRRVLSAEGVGLAATVLALAALCYWADGHVLVRLYPHLHAALFLATLAFAQLFCWMIASKWLERTPSTRGRQSLVGAGAVLAYGFAWMAACDGSAGTTHDAQNLVLRDSIVQRRLISWARQAADRDDDGYSSLLGGGDCRDDDPAIHPGARDVGGNAIDEDCSGADLYDEMTADSEANDQGSIDAATAPPAPEERPNIILITIDALRADHVGAYGYTRPTTPALDALARESLLFTRAISTSDETGHSLASLFTGLIPSKLDCYYPAECSGPTLPSFPVWPELADGQITLPECLKANGYGTAMGSMIRKMQTWTLTRGFDVKIEPAHMWQETEAFAARQRSPFFLWIHETRVHEPYEKHPGFDFGDEPMDRYDSALAYTDSVVGGFLARLGQLGLKEKSILIVTADHGEEFGDHGGQFHGTTLYEEQIRVPLIVRVPARRAASIDRVVAQVDLMPTLLRFLNIDCGVPFGERSLLSDHAGVRDEAYSERLRCGRLQQRTLIRRDLKLISSLETNTVELYDLQNDPGERKNLADVHADVLKTMKRGFERWQHPHRRTPRRIQ